VSYILDFKYFYSLFIDQDRKEIYNKELGINVYKLSCHVVSLGTA
jgi:hypothetical protein